MRAPLCKCTAWTPFDIPLRAPLLKSNIPSGIPLQPPLCLQHGRRRISILDLAIELNNKEFISHRYCQGILDVRILFLYFYCD